MGLSKHVFLIYLQFFSALWACTRLFQPAFLGKWGKTYAYLHTAQPSVLKTLKNAIRCRQRVSATPHLDFVTLACCGYAQYVAREDSYCRLPCPIALCQDKSICHRERSSLCSRSRVWRSAFSFFRYPTGGF